MKGYTFCPRRYRDLTIIDLDEHKALVIACDSAGAIGPKEADVIKVSGYILGRFTSRVALMEVLAAGAWPCCVVNTLCVEPIPTGLDIQQGVADEIRVLGIDPATILTGSTEKNIPTSQSGIGVTVIGVVHKQNLRIGRLRAGDALLLLGKPKVGNEVSLYDPEIVNLETVRLLLSSEEVREMVPLGSRGIMAEAQDLAELYGLRIQWNELPPDLNLHKSCGPATCLLAAGNPVALKDLAQRTGKPFFSLGTFYT